MTVGRERRIPRWLASALRLTLLLTAAAGLGGCTDVFLQPDRVDHYPEMPWGTTVEDRWLASADGTTLHALYMPTAQPPKATILYLHGNAENLSTHAHLVSWLPPKGFAVLAPDYRGYGKSGGDKDIAGAHADAEAALAWLVGQGAGKTGPIIVYGQSIGASIAIRMVATSSLRTHVRALISDSAFADYRDIARSKLGQFWLTWPFQYPLSWLISDRYSPLDVVADIAPIPLLILQGDADRIVPPDNAQQLFDAAHEPKQLWIVHGAHHIESTFDPKTRRRFVEYLTAASTRKSDPD